MSDDQLSAERQELFYEPSDAGFPVIEKRLSTWEKLYSNAAARKGVLLLFLAAAWEIYARWLNNPLLFPSLFQTVGALIASIRSGEPGELPEVTWYSIQLLFKGYAVGLLFAAVLTAVASSTRIGADLLETLTSIFNPLPSIALLPLAFIWFGLGDSAVIFVLVHAVLWAVALNTHSGFRSVSSTLRMVGRNYGLSRVGYITRILIPAAFPSILTGLKIGWAFAWRTLIAAELVFGVSSGRGGLGWYIFVQKNLLSIPDVFAGLLTVMLIGLFVENLIFKTVERLTVRRWGMET